LKPLSEQKARETSLFITAFVRGGGQEKIGVPTELVTDLIKTIQKEGYALLQLAGEKSLEITGILVTGKIFHQEERIIFSGLKD
jgi:hypothetical protein